MGGATEAALSQSKVKDVAQGQEFVAAPNASGIWGDRPAQLSGQRGAAGHWLCKAGAGGRAVLISMLAKGIK